MGSVLSPGCTLELPGFQNNPHQVPTPDQYNQDLVGADGLEALVQLKSSPGDAKVQAGLRATGRS